MRHPVEPAAGNAKRERVPSVSNARIEQIFSENICLNSRKEHIAVEKLDVNGFAGIVRIPNERAMRILVQQGGPAAPPGAASTPAPARKERQRP